MDKLRLPVLLLANLFCVFLNAGQLLNSQCCPYVGTVEISPQNPTATDSVYLVTEITTPGQGLYLGTETTLDQNNQIEVRSCYVDGVAASPLQFSNTINLGVFAAGNYNLNFNAISSASSLSCMPVDSNSVDLNFTVLPVAAQNCPTVVSSPQDELICHGDILDYYVVLDDPSLGTVVWTMVSPDATVYLDNHVRHRFFGEKCNEEFIYTFDVVCSDGTVVDSGSFTLTAYGIPIFSTVSVSSTPCQVEVILDCPEFVITSPEGASFTPNPGEMGSVDFVVENPVDPLGCQGAYTATGFYHCPATPCAAPYDYQLNLVDIAVDEDDGTFTLTLDFVTGFNDPNIPYFANGAGLNNFPVFEGTPLIVSYSDGIVPFISVSDVNGCDASWNTSGPINTSYLTIGCDGTSNPNSSCIDPFGNPGLYNFHCECDPNFEFSLSPAQPFSSTRITGKVALEGFLQSDGTMSTYLSDSGLLPLSQPFSGPPYNYMGTESMTSIPPNTVDWVLLEFKNEFFDDNTGAWDSDIFQTPALINSDGLITDLNGELGIVSPFLNYNGNNPYYTMTIRHNGHLDLTHDKTVDHGGYNIPHDNYRNFTYSAESVQGVSQTKPLHGKYAMRAGDFDGNQTINFLDFLEWFALNNTLNIYNAVDADGNGTVNFLDFLFWFDNNNVIGYEPE